MNELPEGITVGRRLVSSDEYVRAPTSATAYYHGGPRDGDSETLDLPAPEVPGYRLLKESREIGTRNVSLDYGSVLDW